MQQSFEDEQRGADRDGRVGDVERRPVPAEGVQVDEVDDVAEAQPVDEVAERAAEDQCQAEASFRGS
jgi:hypothetical protein